MNEVPAAFSREQGCTEAEWLGWLPGAVDGRALALQPGQARIEGIGSGGLTICWRALEPRRIALIRLPRLAVDFRFDAGVEAPDRQRFMRRFDLWMQRGGG
ncbi:hypothetical protein X805_12230 [Sphaerotilus natans subsp. natans DSM 6575]|uniref:Uncharacterized protein n=1 Tax=Sphaerotilus natans subsp. natans DSM 6575 TaxID=1286631 RepID=A0A059KNX7_9BURK|nr:hypothetical protein [Sphaerotilus natans]KDB53187.1 hypothetical protein X805_12230 [Sphaerotilus natans subsp. natans DSM 6575]SIR18931.1 hypothetical protein SAMN05421778_107156 [Sphaerotilus natans]